MGFPQTDAMLSAIFFGFKGSVKIAAFPQVSSRQGMRDVTTGHPVLIASSGVSPKPSYKDG